MLATLGLERDIVDVGAYRRTVEHLRAHRVVLPTFAELAEPSGHGVAAVDPDTADPRNLFRVHWHNAADREAFVPVPEHVVLPESLTGVEAPIVVLLGNRFPMIGTHKVLAAYACLAPRLVTGSFDPTRQRAVWPSTGNYARGGVAISRIMGCRGVAVLPEQMSRERFEWLDRWVTEASDIVRTPGSESNVKEIYDACAELAADPDNVVLNQFCEFGNHLAHYAVTGPAAERVLAAVRVRQPDLRCAAFVAATGSAGTLGAGDYLKERAGARIVAVEPLECPTLLYNGYGAHNIQGIGDKHVPLIHNVTNTDVVTAVTDRATDAMNVFATTSAGTRLLRDRGVPDAVVAQLPAFGLSSWCNVIAAIKVARALGLGADDAILTVATDGADLYRSERERTISGRFSGSFDTPAAAAVHDEYVLGADRDHVLELSDRDRNRIFNLGYFTWVEQQNVPLDAFEARREQQFWRELRPLLPAWDEMIVELNERTRPR
jgi:cysteine synthase